MFASGGGGKVVFADVNLREAPDFRGTHHQPGAGGWPTIRYFNSDTGIAGEFYKKKHADLPMCQELGDVMRMIDYVVDAGGSFLCDIYSASDCTEKEMEYVQKIISEKKHEDGVWLNEQLQRLQSMDTQSMKFELKEWNWRRILILRQFIDEMEDDDDDYEEASEL